MNQESPLILVDVQEGDSEQIKNNEVILEKLFMNNNGFSVGDRITIEGKEYTIKAKATVPDYCHRVAEITDVGTDEKFGLAFVNEDTYRTLQEKYQDSISYNYTYVVNKDHNVEKTQQEIFDYLYDTGVHAKDITDTYVLEKIKNSDTTKTNICNGFTKLQEGMQAIITNTKAISSYLGGMFLL